MRERCTAFCLGARGGAGPRLEEGIGGSGRSAVLTEADMVDGSKEGEVVESGDGGGTGLGEVRERGGLGHGGERYRRLEYSLIRSCRRAGPLRADVGGGVSPLQLSLA